MTTEAQKRAAAKYQREKSHKAAVRLKLNEYQLLETYCKENNYTIGGLLRDRISDIIKPDQTPG